MVPMLHLGDLHDQGECCLQGVGGTRFSAFMEDFLCAIYGQEGQGGEGQLCAWQGESWTAHEVGGLEEGTLSAVSSCDKVQPRL